MEWGRGSTSKLMGNGYGAMRMEEEEEKEIGQLLLLLLRGHAKRFAVRR